MDVLRAMCEATDFTPSEQQLAQTILALGARLQGQSIKELAGMASVSIASVHRFCKKLGLEGFKELKVECARAEASRASAHAPVDINFPFKADEDASTISTRMGALYETTITDTLDLLDLNEIETSAQLIAGASRVDIYAHSHNVHPAQMFEERLLSIGKPVNCPLTWEREIRCALGSDQTHVALVISYSGLSRNIRELLPVLHKRRAPVIFVGSPAVRRRNPGLAAYLFVSDREHLQNRITQFSSHIAVQFVLDTLFSCVFARNYDCNRAFLTETLPYTMLGSHHPSALSDR